MNKFQIRLYKIWTYIGPLRINVRRQGVLRPAGGNTTIRALLISCCIIRLILIVNTLTEI